jgi:nicotinamide riboside kinase
MKHPRSRRQIQEKPLIVRFLLKDDLKQFVSDGQTIPDAASRRSDFSQKVAEKACHSSIHLNESAPTAQLMLR